MSAPRAETVISDATGFTGILATKQQAPTDAGRAAGGVRVLCPTPPSRGRFRISPKPPTGHRRRSITRATRPNILLVLVRCLSHKLGAAPSFSLSGKQSRPPRRRTLRPLCETVLQGEPCLTQESDQPINLIVASRGITEAQDWDCRWRAARSRYGVAVHWRTAADRPFRFSGEWRAKRRTRAIRIAHPLVPDRNAPAMPNDAQAIYKRDRGANPLRPYQTAL